MRFFGGTLRDWLEADAETVSRMLEVMRVLESREMLDSITVSTFPHMKQADQSKTASKLRKQLEPPRELKALTMADIAKVIKGG